MLHPVLTQYSVYQARLPFFFFFSLPLEREMASIYCVDRGIYSIDVLMLTSRTECYLHADTLHSTSVDLVDGKL